MYVNEVYPKVQYYSTWTVKLTLNLWRKSKKHRCKRLWVHSTRWEMCHMSLCRWSNVQIYMFICYVIAVMMTMKMMAVKLWPCMGLAIKCGKVRCDQIYPKQETTKICQWCDYVSCIWTSIVKMYKNIKFCTVYALHFCSELRRHFFPRTIPSTNVQYQTCAKGTWH